MWLATLSTVALQPTLRTGKTFFGQRHRQSRIAKNDPANTAPDPTNATIYDLGFVRALYRNFGQRIVKVVPPGVRGHQWVVISANEAGDDVEFPVEGTFGSCVPR